VILQFEEFHLLRGTHTDIYLFEKIQINNQQGQFYLGMGLLFYRPVECLEQELHSTATVEESVLSG
jgi:hypothetical protein